MGSRFGAAKQYFDQRECRAWQSAAVSAGRADAPEVRRSSNADTVADSALRSGTQESGTLSPTGWRLGPFRLIRTWSSPRLCRTSTALAARSCAAIARPAAWRVTASRPIELRSLVRGAWAGSAMPKFVLWLLVAAATGWRISPRRYRACAARDCGRMRVSLAACLALCAATLAWRILGTGFAVLAVNRGSQAVFTGRRFGPDLGEACRRACTDRCDSRPHARQLPMADASIGEPARTGGATGGG